jgi:hypothetical protein
MRSPDNWNFFEFAKNHDLDIHIYWSGSTFNLYYDIMINGLLIMIQYYGPNRTEVII